MIKIRSGLKKIWYAFNNSVTQVMMCVGLLVFFIVIAVFTRKSYSNAENPVYNVHNYNKGWVLNEGNVQHEIEFLPEKFYVKCGEVYHIKNVLPEELPEHAVLTMHTFRTNIEIFIDGGKVYSYYGSDKMFKKSPTSKVHFIPIEEMAGKEIAIYMQSWYTRYSGRVDEFYWGTYEECMGNVLRIYMPILLLYASFIVVGIVLLIAFLFIRKNRLKYINWSFFGIFTILFSLNFILDYNMVQFWNKKEEMINIGYWITLLLYPIAYLAAIYFSIQCKIGKIILKIMVFLQTVAGFCIVYLHMREIMDFSSLIDIYRGIMYIGFLITIVLVVWDMIERHTRTLLSLFFSQVMILQVLWVHVISFYFYPLSYQNGGVVFGAGIISAFVILSGTAINKTTDSLEEVDKVKKDLMESRVQLMIHQIQPHFIFNTLNSIQALIDIDSQKASEMLTHFSKYLRTHIDTMEMEEMILFHEELQNIKEYISIEMIRFPRLNVIYEIEQDMFLVPALSIQPIVENAVKHGISQKISGGTVWIKSWEEKSYYVISIEDNGVGFEYEERQGGRKTYIGMKNITFRLNTLMNAKVSWKSEPHIGTKVNIQIPKK